MRVKVGLVLAALMLAFAGIAAVTPETSRLFDRHVDPQSGVVSYMLKPGLVADNQQSIYFTAKSMTDDGRFLVFWTSANEFKLIDGKKPSGKKATAIVDFERDEIVKLDDLPASTPFIDVKTDQMWYVSQTPPRICRRDLKVDPRREVTVCAIPTNVLLSAGERVAYYCTHITLTKTRDKAFLDLGIRVTPDVLKARGVSNPKTAGLDETCRFVQGTLDLKTGAWDEWCRAPFYCNHGQLNPQDDNLAMCAWEKCWRSKEALRWREISEVYPRIWLFRKGRRPELIVPELRNGATHEAWDEDGKGFYWCCGGVYHCELESRKQEVICPLRASHADKSADNRYITFDDPVGTWYRGCSWRVGFWNRDTQQGVYIHSKRPPLCPQDDGWHHHPDPHPHFVCRDRYVVCTINNADGHMDLTITPVAQLVEKTTVAK